MTPMRAVVIPRPGGPEVLEIRDVPTPSPGPGEVRVAVHATAVNRADLLQRMGHYPAPPDAPPDIPGLEYAGVVDAVGPGVTDHVVGQRVYGLVGGGAYAEALVVHGRAVVPIPEGLSMVEAAAVPEAFLTAYDAVVTQGGLAAGETLVVHAVGSGVGTAAVQIANLVGARVVGTARTATKLQRATELGLHEGVLAEGGTFAEAVRKATGGRGADVVLELVGGPYLAEDLACTATSGRIVLVGLLAGRKVELDLGALLGKRLLVKGTTLRARPLEEKIAVAQVLHRNLGPALSGPHPRLRPVVDRVMPLEAVADAHVYMASNDGFGKVVLTTAHASR